MGKVYDDWEKLVEAVLRREKLRQLCYAHSVTSSDSSSVLDHDYLHLYAETTMARLQEQLIYTLTQNKQCFEHGYSSPPSSDPTVASPRQSIGSETEDCEVDLLDPDTVCEIKAIAGTMFASGCDGEFCEVFARFGKSAFDVYFTILDVEELSSEGVAGLMESKSLNSVMKKWRFAIKKFIVLYLYKAKLVFNQVLGEYGDASSRCLIEASKPSLMWFLNFGLDLALGPHRPENLLGLLDMYEDLIELIPSVKALFANEIGSCVLVELHNLLAMLEDSAKDILMELVNAIRTNPSSTPFPNGGIHPLTRYVVDYILCFEEYDRTLGLILKERDCEDASADADDEQSVISGALATHLHPITSALEAKIANMSGLYDDPSLEHIFVMNNIHYMVEKIDSSKIRPYFGDEWIRRRTMDFRVRALSYERSTWSSILPLLRLDGKVDRATAKARCRDFAVAFMNVHKNQTRWLVPSLELREELRISASITLGNAYRSFLGSVKNVLGNKHIKYSVHELETLILDLFEGSSNSMPSNSQMDEGKSHKERLLT